MKLTTAWHTSLTYFFSAHAWRVMGCGVWRALPLALIALALMATMGLSGLFAKLFNVMPPLIAVVGSPLYLLPLIRLHDQTNKHHPWLPYITSGALFYGAAGAVAWASWQLYIIAPLWAAITLSGIGLLCLPFLIVFLWVSPFLMTAYAYEPTARRSRAAIWRHACRMSWHELPFVFLLLVCMTPVGLLVYGMPGLLVAKGIVAVSLKRTLLHMGSVLYWLLGWSVFILYYQDRKKRYLKT